MSDTDAILDKLRGCMRTAMKLSDAQTAAIDLATTPATVSGWTSTAHLELLLALEREFDMMFDADEIGTLASTAAIVTALQRPRP